MSLSDCFLVADRLVSSDSERFTLMSDVACNHKAFFGLRGGGRVGPGYQADLVVFDLTDGAAPVRTVFDLPGQSKRLLADPIGVSRVFVNGIETIVDGKLT